MDVLRDEFIHAPSVDKAQPKVDEAREATTRPLFPPHFIGFVADRVRAALEDISISTPSLLRMSLSVQEGFVRVPRDTRHPCGI